MSTILVSLAGNPNVGKTTLLNQMSGSNLNIGNWAGVTTSKKEATTLYKGHTIHFIDLPGIYTLDPISEAEEVAVGFLTNEKVDVILNVIDSTNLARNLSLTTEILEFEAPTVLALNMIDEAGDRGIDIDLHKLEELLGVGAVETNGKTGKGMSELLDKIVEAHLKGIRPPKQSYNPEVERALTVSAATLGAENGNKRSLIESLKKDERLAPERERLEKYFGKETGEIVSEERWGFAHGLGKRVERIKKNNPKRLTEKLDDVLLHPYLGIVIYVFLFYMVFKLSFDFSTPYMNWIDGFLNQYVAPLSVSLLLKIGAPVLVLRFISEALFGGLGFVLTFVPLVACIFFFITLLEMSGYLPRIAFLMDRFLHKLGLQGNMITPLLLGFGCNVPAIMSTRNMTSRRDKLLVTMMIPFMSCPARLVVFAFFAITFFDHPALIIFGLYLVGMVVAVLTALVLRRSLFKGKTPNFVLELPPYRVPSRRVLMRIVWAHVKSFITRAGVTILVVTVLVWFLLNLPPNASGPGKSAAAYVGKIITPVFEPIGLSDWRATTSLIPAFMARELVLSTMGIIYKTTEYDENFTGAENFDAGKGLLLQGKALGGAVRDSFVSIFALVPGVLDISKASGGNDTLRSVIKRSFTPLSAYSFMILMLVYNSCIATVTVMIREVGRKYALSFLAYSFVIAWVLACLIYQIGSRIS